MSCLKNYKVIIDHSKTDGSIVWNYFGELSDNMGIIQPDKYFCAECLKNEQNKDKQFLKNLKCYSKSSSTGNLKAHLIERHKLSFTPKTPSKSDISKWFTSSPRTPILRKSDPELAESIFLMCARDLLPFQFVEKEGFKDFTNKYLPNRSLPTRQTIVRAGARVTEQIKEYIVDYLASENNIFGTGTLDCWTDMYKRRSYIGFTYHFIDKQFKIKNILLGARYFEHPHTGEAIADNLKNILNEFRLTEKCKIWVTDNATNNIKFARVMDTTRLGCDAHGIHNLIMRDAFGSSIYATELLTRCKTIVKALVWKDLDQFNSKEVIETISSIEDEIQMDDQYPIWYDKDQRSTTLKQEVPTRWSSALRMIKSVLDNINCVTRLLEIAKKYELILSDREICDLRKLSEFLDSFSVVTKKLEGCQYTTLNLAVQYRESLYEHCKPEDRDEDFISQMKRSILQNWDKRLPSLEIHIAAALMDHSTKHLKTVSDFLKNKDLTAAEFLTNVMTQLDIETNTTSLNDNDLSPAKKAKLEEKLLFVRKYGNFTALEVSSFKIEVDKFMMMPLSAETLLLDTLDWWKSHQAEYPMMSILVRSLYSVPSTAAAIERVWSSSGLTISSRRSCLGPTNFENLIFVHENYAFVKSDNSNF